jgi:hypothetical protein
MSLFKYDSKNKELIKKPPTTSKDHEIEDIKNV